VVPLEYGNTARSDFGLISTLGVLKDAIELKEVLMD